MLKTYASSLFCKIICSAVIFLLLHRHDSLNITDICIPTAEGVKNSITSALETLQLRQGQSFLVQFWAAIKIGKTYVLTTTCQPFGFCGINQELESYRIACLDHKLYVHPEKRVAFGLPGRVFLNRIHEETQNVHNYTEDHRPPCQDVIFFKKWGSFAVPVMIDTNTCVGVLEFITDPPQDSYADNINVVQWALENAGFQSSIQIHHPRVVTSSPDPWKGYRRSYSLTKTKYCCLVPYFGLSSDEAAKRLGINCQSTFSNVRSKVGIPEWPSIPSHKTTRAIPALETENSPTAAGTTSSEPTIAEDDMPDWDIGNDENLCIQTGAYLPETQTNEKAYDSGSFGTDNVATDYMDDSLHWTPICDFGIPDLSYTLNGASLPEVQINQIASDNHNSVELWTESECVLANFMQDSDEREDEGNMEDHDQEMSISSLFDFERWNVIPCYD